MTFTDLRTLQQAIIFFSDEQNCINTVAAMRWSDGKPTCPACEHKEHYYLASQKRWKCRECWKQFSVKVGTIFEDSRLPLTKWMLAMWMIANCRNGVSSWEIHRAIGVTQKSAWFMMHRIRRAMTNNSLLKLGADGGEVEADETFIGGKARNMHVDVRKRRIPMQGSKAGKVIVMGTLERGGDIRAHVIHERSKGTVQTIVKNNVHAGAALFTDEHGSYRGLESEYQHEIVDHTVKYVDGRIHTNGMENFWALLKRGLSGTYISVEPFHLFRYLDEQIFRFNNRNRKKAPVNDRQRFQRVLSQVAGKHITYSELTGKERLPVVAPEPF